MEIASEFAKSDYSHGNLLERQIKTLTDFSFKSEYFKANESQGNSKWHSNEIIPITVGSILKIREKLFAS